MNEEMKQGWEQWTLVDTQEYVSPSRIMGRGIVGGPDVLGTLVHVDSLYIGVWRIDIQTHLSPWNHSSASHIDDLIWACSREQKHCLPFSYVCCPRLPGV